MKHIADFCVDGIRFKEKDMRHQLYLMCRGYGIQNKEIANNFIAILRCCAAQK